MQELQPVHGYMSSSEPIFHFGVGNKNKIDSLVIIWPDNTFQWMNNIATNQKIFVIYKKENTDTIINYSSFIEKLLNQPDTSFFTDITAQVKINFKHKEAIDFYDYYRQPLIPHEVSASGPRIAVGDVNGDGLEDFFVCGGNNQASKLFIQQPDGTFISADDALFAEDTVTEKADAIFFDADNDGDLDLYVAGGGGGIDGQTPPQPDRLYINDGHGNFRRSLSLPAIYGDKSVVCAGDFDGDGFQDLFVGGRVSSKFYGSTPTSYLLHNDGHGNFSIVTDEIAKGLSTIGMVTGACWTDVNKDGKPDLVVVGEWMPPTVFINHLGKLEQQHSSLDTLTGWWCTVKSEDINGDGYPDLLLGNYGLNSKLKASVSFPIKMYVADFDNDGRQKQILSIQKKGKYYPFLGKKYLENQMPYLKKEFLGYREMAGKTTENIFGKKLDASVLFQAAALQSMVLLNDRHGGFTAVPLPAQMQWSPLFSFYADDFNRDNKKDLLAGGNFYGVIPFEGRYDAMPMTMGMGNGNGNFKCALPYEKPIINGEIRDIKPIRIAGKKCIIVARRNDSLVILQY
jgi:enediyne biosynthesis protein E4